MTSPLEAIVVRFGAEWTGGAVINRIVSDINRMVSAGKQAGDPLSMTKMLTGIEDHDRAIAKSAVKLGVWQAHLKDAQDAIRSLGAQVADGSITSAEAAEQYLVLSENAKLAGNVIAATTPRVASFGATLARAMPLIIATGAALVGLKKGFDMWKEAAELGAGIRQTGDSFRYLTSNLYNIPNMLADMRTAAHGTISDMQLMASFMTLVAGTTPQMGKALADAAPKLLEISKAANALNPTLGDTTFFFDSLARGIKRSEIRIIDNLGLNLKVGDANKKWAEQLGKTVVELTAEERQMALLNETIRVGTNLIDQLGGRTDSLVDPYMKLAANTENIRNGFREMISVSFEPIIGGLASMTSGLADAFAQAQDTYTVIKAMYELNAKGFGAPVDFISPTALADMEVYVDTIRELIRAYGDLGLIDIKSKDFIEKATVESLVAAIGPLDASADSWGRYAKAREEARIALSHGYRPATEDEIDALARGKMAAAEYKASMKEIRADIDAMFGSSARYYSFQGQQMVELSVGNNKVSVSLSEIKKQLDDIRTARANALFGPGVNAPSDYDVGRAIDVKSIERMETVKEQSRRQYREYMNQLRSQMPDVRNAALAAQAIEREAAAIERYKEAVAAARQQQSASWMNIFAGGNFNSDLIVGDIRDIGAAWVSTSNATREQTERIAELSKNLEKARAKLRDMEDGIGVQGDKAGATAKKISDLNAEIANYERLLDNARKDIKVTTSTKDIGLDVNDLEVYKQFITTMGEWNAPVDQLAAVAQGLGLISPAAADAMLKMTLLQGAMDNLNFKLRTGQIDPGEIPQAIDDIIETIEQDKSYGEIVLDMRIKAKTRATYDKQSAVQSRSAIADEYGKPIEIEVAPELSVAEKTMLGWLNGVEGEKPTVSIAADDKEARTTLTTLTNDIEKANPVLSIYGKYVPDPTAPSSGSNPVSVPPGANPSFARGGYIPGGRGDKKVINAHAGEFVMRPEAVDRLGVGFLMALNQGNAVPQGNSVTVQNSFYAPIGTSEVREVVLRSADDGAKQISDLLARGGYKLR